MNPTTEINRLLEDSGAVLIRRKKHLVYRLPNGTIYTRAKTASDHRAERNNVSILRHMLGANLPTQSPKERRAMQPERTPTPAVAAPAPAQPETIKQRIEAAIAIEESMQEKLLAEAQTHERAVQMLKALLPFADDPAIEGSLRGLLPAPAPPAPPKREPTPPPEAITERVQVTRQLVFAATQTFDDTFTVNDIVDRMTNGADIDQPERLRVRSSIAQCMATLHERGEVLKESQGIGRQQSVWRKVNMNGHGNVAGMRA